MIKLNEPSTLGRRIDGLLSFGEALSRPDGNAGQRLGSLGSKVVNTARRIKASDGAEEHRRTGLDFVVDNHEQVEFLLGDLHEMFAHHGRDEPLAHRRQPVRSHRLRGGEKDSS